MITPNCTKGTMDLTKNTSLGRDHSVKTSMTMSIRSQAQRNMQAELPNFENHAHHLLAYRASSLVKTMLEMYMTVRALDVMECCMETQVEFRVYF